MQNTYLGMRQSLHVKILILILVFSFSNFDGFSQSLSPERVAKIKSATVRIEIDSSTNIGTGFFINKSGWLLTCWHVITPALVKNHVRKIYAVFPSGEKIEYGISSYIQDSNFLRSCQIFDFSLLVPVKKSNKIFPFLELGNYSNLLEGESIYTCGYPLAIPQQFVSQGIVSTKYIDTILLFNNNILLERRAREQALLDLTLNKGNSGGAILKLGQNPVDDKVVAIADFVIIPYGQAVEQLNTYAQEQGGDVEIMGISTMKAYRLFSGALSQASNGISGAVSIEHFLRALEDVQKKTKR